MSEPNKEKPDDLKLPFIKIKKDRSVARLLRQAEADAKAQRLLWIRAQVEADRDKRARDAEERRIEKARAEWEAAERVRVAHILRGREASADLVRHSARRGMSTRRLHEIWGRTFVDAALGTREMDG
jgi:hypothetical protein